MATTLLALVCGTLTYIRLFNHPIRGDTWLIYQTLAGLSLFLWKVKTDDLSAAAYFAFTSILLQISGIVITALAYRLSPFHPLYMFPGPWLAKATSLYQHQMVYSGRRFERLVELHNKYGPFLRTGPNTLSINSNAAVGPVYSAASAWHKSPHYHLARVPGSGLFWIEHRDVHNARKRHFWAPAFTSDSVVSYYPILDRRTEILLGVIGKTIGNESKGIVDVSKLLQYWVHDVTGDLTFGDVHEGSMLENGDPENHVKAALLQVENFELCGEAPSLYDFLWYLPVTSIFRMMHERSNRLLERRRARGSLQPDIMSHLLNDSPSIPKLSDDDLRQDITLAILAGTNAVSACLTYAVYFAAKHPQVYAKLEKEILTAFSDFDGTYIDHDKLSGLPYLNAFAEETFRLGCPVGALSRVAPIGGAVVADHYIPEGTIVSVPPWAQNIHPENFYPRPLEFEPERWLPGGLGPNTITNKNSMMTFSHGPFGCIGRALGYHQIRVMMARLMLQYNFKLPDDFDSDAFWKQQRNLRAVTFVYPLNVVFTPRM